MKIYINYNGKVSKITFKQRNGIFNRLNTLAIKENGKMTGHVKVDYGKGFDNQFDFSGIKDLKNKLTPCLEKELLRFLNV